MKIQSVATYPPKLEQEETKEIAEITPPTKANFETIWDLEKDTIFFGLKLINQNYYIRKHEELHISYGERANSFLIVEYGFTIRDNPFDFVRRKNITIDSFYPQAAAG